jgi:hypothetical protein
MNAESQSIGISRRIPGNDEECRNDAREFDRGTFDTLTFTRCCRGYTLVANRDYGRRTVTMAFDRIESVACWLVEQYNPAHAEQVKAAEAAEIEKNNARSRKLDHTWLALQLARSYFEGMGAKHTANYVTADSPGVVAMANLLESIAV